MKGGVLLFVFTGPSGCRSRSASPFGSRAHGRRAPTSACAAGPSWPSAGTRVSNNVVNAHPPLDRGGGAGRRAATVPPPPRTGAKARRPSGAPPDSSTGAGASPAYRSMLRLPSPGPDSASGAAR